MIYEEIITPFVSEEPAEGGDDTGAAEEGQEAGTEEAGAEETGTEEI